MTHSEIRTRNPDLSFALQFLLPFAPGERWEDEAPASEGSGSENKGEQPNGGEEEKGKSDDPDC